MHVFGVLVFGDTGEVGIRPQVLPPVGVVNLSGAACDGGDDGSEARRTAGPPFGKHRLDARGDSHSARLAAGEHTVGMEWRSKLILKD